MTWFCTTSGEKIVDSDVGAMIGVMTDSDLLVQEALASQGGMNMCTALERLKEEGREEGREQGRREMLFALLQAGAEMKLLREVSGLTEEEIEKLRKEIK